ncbi:MAG: hypothetical protein JSW34_12935 [Candidatus Zixiibacteriota bacterium]|nr:MAG: hypothetical protein JSW34_12935 [candidate division Zixibacteria bacterium]
MPGIFGNLLVTERSDIEMLLGIIHDEFFEVDAIKYDASAGKLEIPFARAFHDQNARVVKKGFFRTIYEVPVLRCLLCISNVEEYTLEDTQHMGWYDFNTIKYNPKSGIIRINTNIPLKFFAEVSKLHIEYSEIGFRGKAHISHGWFWEGGPHFVED